ncbi:TPA: undecaprenyl-phosphate glucose phosphotransferase [Klebsiella pneumoniae]|nr:undecaprenyl-phosphate glucose phosphotransferase [Klebsiella pneumoniae]HCG2949838.1 undecaprenyl-phosphate glucose phosphotransferase [Klebsiella pneumoniae]
MTEIKHGVLHANASIVTTIQRISDTLIIAISFWLITLARNAQFSLSQWVILLGVLCIFQLLTELFNLYRSWRGESIWNEIYYVEIVWTISLVIFYFFNEKIINISSLVIDYHTLWFLVVTITLATFRIALRLILKFIRSNGYNSRTAVIVGAGPLGKHLAYQLKISQWLGINVLGFYDDKKSGIIDIANSAFPIFGELDQLIIDAKGGAIDRIYITLPMRYEKRIHELVTALSDTTCSVLLVPDVFTFNLLHSRASELNGIPLISIFDTPMLGARAFIKRVEDIILASFILILISPLLFVLALAVKLTSKGPVIFKQRRYGIDGKPIAVWKFRSMTVTEDDDQVTQATKDDSRLTPIGAFIRGTSLDELPQFINVLVGDMSIVGPRPHAIAHNEQYRKLILGYMLRHKVKPGITGLAQVNGWRGETDTLDKMEKRIEYDLEYIRSWSLWLDLKIVFFTIFKGFINRNAY